MKKSDHTDEKSKINMTEAAGQTKIVKEAEASGFIHLKPETVRMIKDNELEEGEVLAMAEISGMQAAKNTSSLIPLVHHVSFTGVDVKAYLYPNGIEVKSIVKSASQTGLETEALTAVSVALLTLFEICKQVDNSPVISDIKLTRKMHEAGQM
jgi:cyclic pyranopterin monophosphate synthase